MQINHKNEIFNSIERLRDNYYLFEVVFNFLRWIMIFSKILIDRSKRRIKQILLTIEQEYLNKSVIIQICAKNLKLQLIFKDKKRFGFGLKELFTEALNPPLIGCSAFLVTTALYRANISKGRSKAMCFECNQSRQPNKYDEN